MTKMLEKAFAEAARLPEQEQNAFATWILEELVSEERWQKAFASSADALARLADEALEEHRNGNTRPTHITYLIPYAVFVRLSDSTNPAHIRRHISCGSNLPSPPAISFIIDCIMPRIIAPIIFGMTRRATTSTVIPPALTSNPAASHLRVWVSTLPPLTCLSAETARAPATRADRN